MEVKYLSAFELMERWRTTERIAIKAAVEAGLPTMQKGRMVGKSHHWKGWNTRQPDEWEWKPSEYGMQTRQIASEDFESVKFECLVFDVDAVKRFEACNAIKHTSETAKERTQLATVKTAKDRLFNIEADVEKNEKKQPSSTVAKNAKGQILELAKSRELTSAHFKPGSVPEIDEITIKHNVSHDTLRRYVSDEQLLIPSKRGRPSKRSK